MSIFSKHFCTLFLASVVWSQMIEKGFLYFFYNFLHFLHFGRFFLHKAASVVTNDWKRIRAQRRRKKEKKTKDETTHLCSQRIMFAAGIKEMKWEMKEWNGGMKERRGE